MSNEQRYKELVKDYAYSMANGQINMAVAQYITQDFNKLGMLLNIPFYTVYNQYLKEGITEKKIRRFKEKNGIKEEKKEKTDSGTKRTKETDQEKKSPAEKKAGSNLYTIMPSKKTIEKLKKEGWTEKEIFEKIKEREEELDQEQKPAKEKPRWVRVDTEFEFEGNTYKLIDLHLSGRIGVVNMSMPHDIKEHRIEDVEDRFNIIVNRESMHPLRIKGEMVTDEKTIREYNAKQLKKQIEAEKPKEESKKEESKKEDKLKEKILNYLKKAGNASVAEIQKATGISEDTLNVKLIEMQFDANGIYESPKGHYNLTKDTAKQVTDDPKKAASESSESSEDSCEVKTKEVYGKKTIFKYGDMPKFSQFGDETKKWLSKIVTLLRDETLKYGMPDSYSWHIEKFTSDVIYSLAGDRNKDYRQKLMSEIKGIKVPKAKAGVNAIKDMIIDILESNNKWYYPDIVIDGETVGETEKEKKLESKKEEAAKPKEPAKQEPEKQGLKQLIENGYNKTKMIQKRGRKKPAYYLVNDNGDQINISVNDYDEAVEIILSMKNEKDRQNYNTTRNKYDGKDLKIINDFKTIYQVEEYLHEKHNPEVFRVRDNGEITSNGDNNKKYLIAYNNDKYTLYRIAKEPEKKLTASVNKNKIVYGRQTDVIGTTETVKGYYAIMELKDVIPSNDPHTFSKDPRYPDACQVRNYASKKQEQLKVINNASKFNAAFLLSDVPTAVDGPPIVLPEGYVLGGNSRTMSLKRVAAKGEFDEQYKKQLIEKLHNYDIKPMQINDFKEPTLVRVIKVSVTKCDHYSDLFNDPLTQKQDKAEVGITGSRRLRASGNLLKIAELFNDAGAETLRAALDNKSFANKVLDILKREGIVHSGNSVDFVDDSDNFHISGKDRLEAILVGAILQDERLINKAKSYTNIIIRIIPQIVSMETLPKEWNLIPTIHDVIKTEYERRSQPDVVPRKAFVNQISFDKPPVPELVQLVWQAFDEVKGKNLKILFNKYVQSARNASDPSAMFATGDEKPIDVFRTLLNKTLELQNKGLSGLSDDLEMYLDDELVGLNGIGEIETVEMFPETKPQKTRKKKIDYEYTDGNFQVTCKNDKCGIPFDNTKVDHPDKLFQIISKKIMPKLDLAQEHFIVVYLNQEHKVLGYKVINKGTLDQSVVDPKAIIRNALLLGPVKAIALCHNHPSGNPNPSEADMMVTDQVKKILSMMDFSFMDHIIIAGNKYVSLKLEGLADNIGLADGYELPEEKVQLADNEIPQPMIPPEQQSITSSEYGNDPMAADYRHLYDKQGNVDAGKLVTVDQMQKYESRELLLTGVVKQVLERINVPFMILIWGRQGSMKSSFAMIMADEFGKHGKVLYHTNEEKISDARIKERYNRLGLTGRQIYFDDSGEFQTIIETLNHDPSIKYLIIDSLNFMDVPQKEIIQIRNEFPDVSIILIAHSEKMGRHYKGDGLVAFKADTEIKLENGVATVLKHRDAYVQDKEVSIRNQAKPTKYRKRKIDPLYESHLRAIGQMQNYN